MKILFLALMLMVNGVAHASVFPDTFAGQVLPAVAGYDAFKQTRGDLNKDGVEDLVFVLQTKEADATEGSKLRVLLVYFGGANNQYTKVVENSKFIMCEGCGGMMGDPLESIAVDRGSLLVKHYGGSRDRWGYTHRYRFQDGDWALIGYTRMEADNLELTSSETDVNLLTGNVVTVKSKEGEKIDTIEGEVKITQLPKLSEWDWDNPLSY